MGSLLPRLLTRSQWIALRCSQRWTENQDSASRTRRGTLRRLCRLPCSRAARDHPVVPAQGSMGGGEESQEGGLGAGGGAVGLNTSTLRSLHGRVCPGSPPVQPEAMLFPREWRWLQGSRPVSTSMTECVSNVHRRNPGPTVLPLEAGRSKVGRVKPHGPQRAPSSPPLHQDTARRPRPRTGKPSPDTESAVPPSWLSGLQNGEQAVLCAL